MTRSSHLDRFLPNIKKNLISKTREQRGILPPHTSTSCTPIHEPLQHGATPLIAESPAFQHRHRGMLRKYHCDNCSVDITSTTRIRCAAPQCQDYDLCVQCPNPPQDCANSRFCTEHDRTYPTSLPCHRTMCTAHHSSRLECRRRASPHRGIGVSRPR